jgi:SAM-dependent methyltransferase
MTPDDVVTRGRVATRRLVKRVLPAGTRRTLRTYARPVWPPVGLVRFGSLRRLTPVGRAFWERGEPIDRYYIEAFLRQQSGQDDYVTGDIHGRVLEIGDDTYARMMGRWGQPGSPVTAVDVLSPDPAASQATVRGDLTNAPQIPDDTYDCVICTQTLLLIYDVRAAIATLHRILKPGGVLLVTIPGISPLCRPDASLWGDFWRFTSRSAEMLFAEVFDAADVSVESYGNVLSATAFLHRLGVAELRKAELDLRDPDFELIIGVRAIKQRG